MFVLLAASSLWVLLAAAEPWALYPARPIAPPRTDRGSLSKDDFELPNFKQLVRREASKGPNFAGRFAIMSWTCGTWCSSVMAVDFQTGAPLTLPFNNVIYCPDFSEGGALLHRPDSRLLIVRGRLGIDGLEGPCGVYRFVWTGTRFSPLAAAP